MPDSLRETLETILVVDDHEMVRKVVVDILEQANFHVLTADGGASAVRVAQETSRVIDLLLSDVEMPGMSGPDLGEVLKKARPDMHVMLMSGGVDSDTIS